MSGDPSRLCALAGHSNPLALSFLPIHALTAADMLILGAGLCTIMMRTRHLRIAFLAGLKDARLRVYADLFATLWLSAMLLLACGLAQVFLVTTYLGAPAWWQIASTVVRGALATTVAARALLVWRPNRPLIP